MAVRLAVSWRGGGLPPPRCACPLPHAGRGPISSACWGGVGILRGAGVCVCVLLSWLWKHRVHPPIPAVGPTWHVRSGTT